MSCTKRPSGKKKSSNVGWLEDVGETESNSSCRSTTGESGDEWTVDESMANGSSVICGGLIGEAIESDSVDGFWMSTTIVEDCLLRISLIGGGLSGS